MRRAPQGCTIVEVIVAMTLLAAGLLAVARASTAIATFAAHTDALTQTAAIAQSRFEWMRSVPCARLADSSTTTRGFIEEWDVGPTNAASTSASLAVFAPRRHTSTSFTSEVRCR